ncbi:hypothetical protein [Paracoccus spongiarum]|uniref:Uncharacterized protein n=1 Tax=Paracoccus spongiarum TaxID=3064387 RepID=A0ABT9JA57_9RHOB|nr:hypothetical protein [Paracoccus sp. 2205BS29-5]MDP5306544.1 hypothetical protein [Paracoccus sp. 2205BS29-5]
MRRVIWSLICAGFATLAAPAALPAGEAGDAVFADRGPWSLQGRTLDWALTVSGPQAPGFVPIRAGSVSLTEAIDPSDRQPVLELVQKTDSRTRRIGPFPISGGDPVLTFFLEQTTRDMAALTGGSPFYIRNRIKDAVFRGGSIARQGEVATASFQPFADDPNAGRMNGFQTLTLTFVLGDPSQPIRELRARTEGETPGYENRMVLR